MNKKFYIYMLECSDNSIYTGYTDDPERRLEAHNNGRGAKYTVSRRPCRLIYTEEFEDKSTAMRREFYIKHNYTREEKLELVKNGTKDICVSADAPYPLTSYLRVIGRNVLTVRSSGIVSEGVSNHPDIWMCKLGADEGKIIEADESQLSAGYPGEIRYNAACTGKYFIHNLKYTAPELLEAAENAGMEMIYVKQGYTKCSTVIVDENSIITYDEGIAGACEEAGIDVLRVEPGHVELPGYDTGFIGGTSGRVGNEIIFNGDLSSHPDFHRIKDFISSKGLKCSWSKDYPLTDIGSII